MPGGDRGRGEADRARRSPTAAGERRGEPHLGDAHHLREQRRVAAQAHAVERETVDVLDREPGVVEGGEHRLAGELERRLGQRLAPLVVGRRADADDCGLVLQCHLPRLRHLAGHHGTHGRRTELGRTRRGRRLARVHPDGRVRARTRRSSSTAPRATTCTTPTATRYLDAISSLWVNTLGHRVPELDAAIARPARPGRAHHDARQRQPRRGRAVGSAGAGRAGRHAALPLRRRRRERGRAGAEDRVPVLGEPRRRAVARSSSRSATRTTATPSARSPSATAASAPTCSTRCGSR